MLSSGPEPPNSNDRLKGPSWWPNTPEAIATIHESIKLARLVLRTLNTS